MRVSVRGIRECHLQSWPLTAPKMAQPSFCAVLHSPVSENIRGALENLSSGPKGRQRHRGTEASACVSDEAEFAEPASLT